jgi:hypothetical protein
MTVTLRILTFADRRTREQRASYHSIVEQRIAWLWEKRWREGVRARVLKGIEARVEAEDSIRSIFRQRSA